MTEVYQDNEYLELLSTVRHVGIKRSDRTGVGTQAVFGPQMRFNLQHAFPLLTTKKVHWKSVVHELLWMLSGSTNVKDLQKHGVTIWDEWADKDTGDLGPVYGKQWRSWDDYIDVGFDGIKALPPIDQISLVQESLRKNPDSRRHIVSAWNPAQIEDVKLPPCHTLFQFFSQPNIPDCPGCSGGGMCNVPGCCVTGPRILHCHLYQRSGDMFLGIPFNIASYSLLTMMLAQTTDHIPGVFMHTIGDAHVYLNHLNAVDTQLERKVLPSPTVTLNPNIRDILDFRYNDITLNNYQSHPAIKAPVAV